MKVTLPDGDVERLPPSDTETAYVIAVKIGRVDGYWKVTGDRFPEHRVDAAHDEMHRIRPNYEDARVLEVTA